MDAPLEQLVAQGYQELTTFRIFITGRILNIIQLHNEQEQHIIAQLMEVMAVSLFTMTYFILKNKLVWV